MKGHYARLRPLALVLLLNGPVLAQETLPHVTHEDEPVLTTHGGSDLPTLLVRQRYEDPLANTVEHAVDTTKRRMLDVDVHTPWQIMHALLGMRQGLNLQREGDVIDGLAWVSDDPVFEEEHWFQVTEYGGRAHPYNKPYAFEGHANQFLAILSMLGLPLDHEFQAEGGTITIEDMVNHAKLNVKEGEEVAWSLWSLSRYLRPDAVWRNKDGEIWSIERLVRLQVEQPLKGTPCGGTHGMFALAHARNVYLQTRKPLRGVWLEADQKIKHCIELARVQQNPNGTFSTKFFQGRHYAEDFDKRIASSGHILEFLMISLAQDQLEESWVRRGVEATARDILANRQEYVKCAPLYHAINGLVIYMDRTQPQQRQERITIRPSTSRVIIRNPNDLESADDSAEESLEKEPSALRSNET